MSQNPLHEAIYQNIVKPAIDAKTFEVDGFVTAVNGTKIDVMCLMPDGDRLFVDVPVANGVSGGSFRDVVKYRDTVKVCFVGGDVTKPFISVIYGQVDEADARFAPYASEIPQSIYKF